MTESEALKLALEALEQLKGELYEEVYVNGLTGVLDKPITAIKEVLAQPKQEPVAWGMPSAGGGFVVDCITPEEHDRVEGGYTVPLYTTPPQRTWVGLTTDEMSEIITKLRDAPVALAFAIEAKLKEKNT